MTAGRQEIEYNFFKKNSCFWGLWGKKGPEMGLE